MEQSAIDTTPKSRSENSQRPRSRAPIPWAVGIAIALIVAVGVGVGIAGVYSNIRQPAPGQACVPKTADEAHLLFEAFFQSPPDSNALAQIARACGR